MESPADALPEVDWHAVASRYDEHLQTRLRSFHAGPAFLDGWVHDEDPARSVLNMFESALAAGLPGLCVQVPAERAADLRRVERTFATLGETSFDDVDGALRVTVRFGAEAAQTARSVAAPIVRKVQRVAATDGPAKHRDDVDAVYRAAVDGALVSHRGSIDGGLVAERDGVRLGVHVDDAATITEARFDGATTPERERVLSRLCALLEGLPMQEASDHAVLRLELALRDRDAPRPVRGIVLPPAASPVFAVVKGLVRDLMAQHVAAGAKVQENSFTPGMSTAWTELDGAAQTERVQRALDALGAVGEVPAGTLRCLRVDRDERVILAFAGEVPRAAQGTTLLRVERYLKRAVEPALHVYLEEMGDRNRLRRL